MFANLRYFLAISFVFVLIGAIVTAYYFKKTTSDIVLDMTESRNQTLAYSYSGTVWEKHKNNLEIIVKIDAGERGKYREFQSFLGDSKGYLDKMNFLKFNLYDAKGNLFFSAHKNPTMGFSDKDALKIETKTETGLHPINVATDRQTASELYPDASYKKTNGRIAATHSVRTLIPIFNKGRVIAVAEVNSDITETIDEINFYLYLGLGVSGLIFLVLYGTLFYTSIKSEKIIEKQYEANEELTSAKSRAEAANEQKSLFLASISHELRTPLNAIIGFSEIMKDEVMGAVGNEQYKNYVRDIYHSGVHLLTLINEILDYSKAEAGKLELEFEEFDLNKLILACLRLQEPRANNGSLKLEKDLPGEHIILRNDSKRLKQILLNLLSNAVKFTPPGGSVSISAWTNVTDKRVNIQVKDSGIGIAAKDLARAFTPFGQVDSALSRKYEGTGLGLPLTKKLTELMGGEMKVESEVEKGTEITIILPPDSQEYAEQQKAARKKGEITGQTNEESAAPITNMDAI